MFFVAELRHDDVLLSGSVTIPNEIRAQVEGCNELAVHMLLKLSIATFA